MSFKRFLIWSSGGPPVQLIRTIYVILKRHPEDIHVKLHEIWTSGSGDAVDRYFLSGALGPFAHLCNFGIGYQEEQFCKIILNLDQWLWRFLLKIFLIWSSCSPFSQRSRIICAISVEGIMRNNSVNIFRIWASDLGGDAV